MSTLTLAQANKIVEVALAKAREMKIKPLAVAVLDQSGHVKSLQREDGASMFRCDVAVGKAWASVGMGVASRTLLQRAKENPQFRLVACVVDAKEVYAAAGIKQLASLPGRQELRAQLLALINTPATQLVRLINTPAGQVARAIDARREQLEGGAA